MSRKTKEAAALTDALDEGEADPPEAVAVADAAPATDEPAPAAVAPSIVVTVAFDGVPDGCIYGRHYEPGEIVEGDLAALALREGWAELRA